jgi:hypothetical protein
MSYSIHTTPEERFRSNLYLKEHISAELDEMPVKVENYLALHWALAAAKGGIYSQAAWLGARWLKRPESIFRLPKIRSSSKVSNFASRLEAVEAALKSEERRAKLARHQDRSVAS